MDDLSINNGEDGMELHNKGNSRVKKFGLRVLATTKKIALNLLVVGAFIGALLAFRWIALEVGERFIF